MVWKKSGKSLEFCSQKSVRTLVREGNDAKKHSNSQLYLFLTKRTQVNATHAQLLEKIETNNCLFKNLPISNDPEDIWQKNCSCE